MTSRLAASLIFLLPLLLGCSEEEDAPPPPSVAAESAAYCIGRTFEEARFTVCPFDSSSQDLKIVLDGSNGKPLRSFEALETDLGPDRKRLLFAMNAGMYGEDGNPVGLMVIDGREIHKLNRRSGPGNFHMLPNGVFARDRNGRVSITPSQDFARSVPHPHFATQSGPMLVIHGKLHPRIDQDGPSRLLRNGVGVAAPARAFFVISDDPVSFGKFARFFRDVLHCPDALFLDGSVSSLWDAGSGRQDAYSELGPMVVVLKPAPPKGGQHRSQPPINGRKAKAEG